MFGGKKKINGLSTARWGEVYCPGCGSKTWIEDRLQQVFHRWGYHRIITSTLERLDTLMAGAIQQSTVIQLQNAEEELGLRPELTASIARTVVTRMAGGTYPQRLYYNANVFRRTPEATTIGSRSSIKPGWNCWARRGLADAEVLLLLADCLNQLGLSRVSLILGGRNRAIAHVAISTCNA